MCYIRGKHFVLFACLFCFLCLYISKVIFAGSVEKFVLSSFYLWYKYEKSKDVRDDNHGEECVCQRVHNTEIDAEPAYDSRNYIYPNPNLTEFYAEQKLRLSLAVERAYDNCRKYEQEYGNTYKKVPELSEVIVKCCLSKRTC